MPDTPEQCAKKIEQHEAAFSVAERAKQFGDADIALKALYDDAQQLTDKDQDFVRKVFSIVTDDDRHRHLPSLVLLDNKGHLQVQESLVGRMDKLEHETARSRLDQEMKKENSSGYEDALKKDIEKIAKLADVRPFNQKEPITMFDLSNHLHSIGVIEGWKGLSEYIDKINAGLEKMHSSKRIKTTTMSMGYWDQEPMIGNFVIEDGSTKSKDISF